MDASPKRGGGPRVASRGNAAKRRGQQEAPSSSRASFLDGSAVQARLGAMIEILVAASRDTYDNNDLIDEKAKALLPGLVDVVDEDTADNNDRAAEENGDVDDPAAELSASPMNRGLETVATALEKFRSESPPTRPLEIMEDGVSKSIPVPLSTPSGGESETLFREMGEVVANKGGGNGNGGGGGGRRATTKAAGARGGKDGGRKSPLQRGESGAVEPPTSDHESLKPKLTRPDANSARGMGRESAAAAAAVAAASAPRPGGVRASAAGGAAADPADAGGYATPYYARPPPPPTAAAAAAGQGKTRYPDYYTPRDHMRSEEYDSRSFPKIGPGYSDTISVVSDLTTPTVATHLVDREYSMMDVMSFQKQSKQMGMLSATELRDEREREAAAAAMASEKVGRAEARGEGSGRGSVPKKTGARKSRTPKDKSPEASKGNERAAGVRKIPAAKDAPGPRDADKANDNDDDDESVDLVEMAARIAARQRTGGGAAEERGADSVDRVGIIKTEGGGKSPKANRSAADRASKTTGGGGGAASKRKGDRKGAASRASTEGAAPAAAGSSAAASSPAAKDSALAPARATSSAKAGAAANAADNAWDAPVSAAAAAPPTAATKPLGPTPGGAAEYRRRKSSVKSGAAAAVLPDGRSAGRARGLPSSRAAAAGAGAGAALPTVHANRRLERTASGRRRRSRGPTTSAKTKVTTQSLTMQDFAPSGSEMPNFFPPTVDDTSTLGSIPEAPPAGKGDRGRGGAAGGGGGGGNGTKKEHNPKRKNFTSLVGRNLLGKKNQRKAQPVRNKSTSSSRQLLSMKSDSYGPETIPEQDAVGGSGKKGIMRRLSSGASGDAPTAGNRGGPSEKSSGKKNGGGGSGGMATWNQDITTSPPGERSNIDLEGVLSTMGQDIDFIFRELSALEDDEGGANAGRGGANAAAVAKDSAKGASHGTSRPAAAGRTTTTTTDLDDDDDDDEKSIASAYTESTMGATAKIKYTLGSVASTLRSKESDRQSNNSFSSAPFPDGDGTSEWGGKGLSQAGGVAAAPPAAAGDPLLIDEDGFIISGPKPAAPRSQDDGGLGDDSFGKGGGAGGGDRGRAGGPQKADSKVSVDGDGFLYEEAAAEERASAPKDRAARKSKRESEVPDGGIRKEVATAKSSSTEKSPEAPPATSRRTKPQQATVSSHASTSASSDSKQSRIDAVEAATKRRIDMLRKLVSDRANQMREDAKGSGVPSGGGGRGGGGGGGGARNGSSGGDKTLNTKLDFVEAETMKQITRLRERLSEGDAGGEGVGGSTLG